MTTPDPASAALHEQLVQAAVHAPSVHNTQPWRFSSSGADLDLWADPGRQLAVLTARFARNHWKYRSHRKAYAGILMDAAHLSQTLQLVSTELGLGAFVTLAINARDIDDRLGLDGVAEGAVAMVGCGPRAPGRSPLELDFALLES